MNEQREKAAGMSKSEIDALGKDRRIMNLGGLSREEINARLRAIGESQGITGWDITAEKVKQFDEAMRQRFGVKWAPPAPVPPEDMDPAAAAKEAGKAVEQARTNPTKRENEMMLNLMILRNALHLYGPATRERAKRAGPTVWRDLRLLTVLVEKVQEALLKTMPQRRDDYYTTYAKHGHYELAMNGPIRNPRMVLISDKYLAALCEAAMEGECTQCFREGRQIGQCMLRQAMLEVAPPRELQDGRWLKCEYRDAAGSLICGEDITI